MPKISIVVPIYNVERYLKQCVDSILNQSLQNIEIILVDDGSTDSSGSICDSYALKDSRVQVIHQSNGGYGKAMNHGISIAQGDFIGIVESDDFIAPQMFEKLYETAKKHHADVVKSSWYQYWSIPSEKQVAQDILKGIHSYDAPFNPRENFKIFSIPPAIWSAIYDAEFLKANNIAFLETPGASYQDTSFAFKIWTCAERVILLQDCFYFYRQDNPGSSVNSKGKAYCICDEHNEIRRFLNERNVSADTISVANLLKLRGYIWNYERLALPLKRDFLSHLSDEIELSSINEEGPLITKKDIHLLKWIKNNPDDYFRQSTLPYSKIRELTYKFLYKLTGGETRLHYKLCHLQQKSQH